MSIRPCGEIGDTSWAYEVRSYIMHELVTYVLLKGILYVGVFILIGGLICELYTM
jgi:hypothetical protein